MTKKQAKQICELWNELFTVCTEPTKTKAIVNKPYRKRNYANNWSVSIIPYGDENDGNAFYHNEEYADVMRAFKVGGYVHIEGGKVVAIIH